jgi:integrase
MFDFPSNIPAKTEQFPSCAGRFRASEVCDLEWSAIDFNAATMQVRRVKNGKPSTHPIRGDELRELRKLRKDQKPQSAFVFVTERGGPFTPESFNHMVKRAGRKAKLRSRCMRTCSAIPRATS